MIQRASARPRTPPPGKKIIVRGGRVMEDATTDTWIPDPSQSKSTSRSADKGAISPGDQMFAHLMLKNVDPLSSKVLIQRELQTNEFIANLRLEAQQAGEGTDDGWSEIGSMVGGGAGRSQSRLRAIFDAFDYDKSGAIDVSELKAILKEMRIEKTPPEVEGLMKEADLNGDGVIDFDEFVAIFSKPTSGLASVFAASGLMGPDGPFSFMSAMFGGGGGASRGG